MRSPSCIESLAGTLVVIGCPADEIHAPGTIERGGGKAISAEAGLWDGVDAALYAHPEFIDTVSIESRRMRRATATVAGNRSLGSADQPPLQAALAALELVRSLVPDDIMLERLAYEGDVEEDTGLVLTATFLLFGDEEGDVERGLATVRDALPGATWSVGRLVEAVRPDDRVTAAVAAAFRTLGHDFVENPPRLPFATDFGNISRRCPAALDRCGPTGRLEVPHRRGRRAVRIAGRRRGRVDDRAGARARGRRALQARLAAPEEAVPERSEEEAEASDRPRLRCGLRRTFLREHRCETGCELPRQLLGDAAEHRPAVLGDGSAEIELRGEIHSRAALRRSQTGTDRRLRAALALDLLCLHGEHGDPFGLGELLLLHLGSELQRYRSELDGLQHLPHLVVDRSLEARAGHTGHDARNVGEERPRSLLRGLHIESVLDPHVRESSWPGEPVVGCDGCAILNLMVQYTTTVDRAFAALGDPTRRAVLERLGAGSATISELAGPFGMSLTGMKKHVRLLEEAELVTTEKVGRVRTCMLVPYAFEGISTWLQRLDRFAQVVEQTKGEQ